MNHPNTPDSALSAVLSLFFPEQPIAYDIKNTCHGEDDFREAVLLTFASGARYVLKLADNDFTFPDKISVWQRCAAAYRALGYYTPAILPAKAGDFPTVRYKGRRCVAYAEEYAAYPPADERGKGLGSQPAYWRDVLIMTAKIAAARLDFSAYPSGDCLFDRFCPSDQTDEVMENALYWKQYAETLPSDCQPQIQRIWTRWLDNRAQLEAIYHRLPTSVFQADLNTSNLLLDAHGAFVGVFDFNLCGRDVFLNYLFRELSYGDDDGEVQLLLTALQTVRPFYRFSALEREAAPLLYRCVKPLWFTKIQRLKAAGGDIAAIRACLEQTERSQTAQIDFAMYMNP